MPLQLDAPIEVYALGVANEPPGTKRTVKRNCSGFDVRCHRLEIVNIDALTTRVVVKAGEKSNLVSQILVLSKLSPDTYAVTYQDPLGRPTRTVITKLIGDGVRAETKLDADGHWKSTVIEQKIDSHRKQLTWIDQTGKVLKKELKKDDVAIISDFYRTVAPYVAAALAFVPGAQVASGVIAAGYLLLDAAEGKPLDPKQIEQVRAAVYDDLGPEGQVAFDVGQFVATGDIDQGSLARLPLTDKERALLVAGLQKARSEAASGKRPSVPSDALVLLPKKYREGLRVGVSMVPGGAPKREKVVMRGFLVKRGVQPQFGTWQPSATGERFFVVSSSGTIQEGTFLVKRPPVVAMAQSSVPGLTVGQREAEIRKRLLETPIMQQVAELERRAEEIYSTDPQMSARLYMAALRKAMGDSTQSTADRLKWQTELLRVQRDFARGIYHGPR